MNLYLIRHGESETDKPDSERDLTLIGRDNVVKMSRWITEVCKPPVAIFSSPLKRAYETAKYFAGPWNLEIRQVEWLLSDVEPSKVIGELLKLSQKSVALVGHLPNLGLLLGTLIWGMPPKEIVIPKAGVALLDLERVEPGSAKLKWMVSVDLLD